MFRQVRTPYINAFLEAATLEMTGSAVTSSYGGQQFATLTNGGSNAISITEKETYGQTMILCASVGDNTTAGGAWQLTDTPTGNTWEGNPLTFSGTVDANDSTFHFLTFKSRGDDTQTIGQDLSGLYYLQNRQGARIVAGRVSQASGVYSIDYGSNAFSLTKNGSGDISVAFDTSVTGFQQAPTVVALAQDDVDSQDLPRVNSITPAGFDVNIANENGAATEAGFSFIAVGGRRPEAFADSNARVIEANFRKPRLFGARFSDQTTVDIGSQVVTSASAGTGIFNISFVKPFSQPPIVLAHAEQTNVFCKLKSVTSSGCVIRCATSGNTAGTPTALSIIVLGTDSDEAF
jgi:hypothetical protein